jgi:hypothetical protein
MSKDIVYCKGTLIPDTVCGKTNYNVGLPDWMIGRVPFDNKTEMERIRHALMKADFNIVKVTESNIYFEV